MILLPKLSNRPQLSLTTITIWYLLLNPLTGFLNVYVLISTSFDIVEVIFAIWCNPYQHSVKILI